MLGAARTMNPAQAAMRGLVGAVRKRDHLAGAVRSLFASSGLRLGKRRSSQCACQSSQSDRQHLG